MEELFSILAGATGYTAPGDGTPPEVVTGDVSSLLDAMIGAGGKLEIYRVTSTEESGDGTFRDAIENRTFVAGVLIPRLVIFDISGRSVQDISTAQDQLSCYRQLRIVHGNIWIAGQTSPIPGDAATRGAGFQSAGRLSVRASNVVIEHIRVEASDTNNIIWNTAKGNNPMQGQGIHVGAGVNTNGDDLQYIERVMIRHCETWWTQDVCAVVGGDANDVVEKSLICRGIAFDNNLFAEGLNIAIAQFQTNGAMVQYANKYATGSKQTASGSLNGHNFGANSRMGSHGILFKKNLISGFQFRTPQATSATSGLLINNVTYGFGCSDLGPDWLWCFDPDIKAHNKQGQIWEFIYWPRESEMLRWEWGAINNCAVGGDRTKTPYNVLADASYIRVRPIVTTNRAGRVDYYDEGNRFRTKYNQNNHPGNDVDDDGVTANYLPANDWVFDSVLPFPGADGITVINTPPYWDQDNVQFNVLTSEETYNAVLADTSGAGTCPAYRGAAARRVIAAVKANRHYAVGLPGNDLPPSEVFSANVIPGGDDVAHKEIIDNSHAAMQYSDGLRIIEAWLHTRHVAVGGDDSFEIQRWINRFFPAA